MERRAFLGWTGGGVLAALSGCNAVAGPSLAEDDFDVGMAHNAFAPREFDATVGDTVVWGNDGSRTHTVTAYESGIPSEAAYFASGGYDSEDAALDAWPGGGAIDPGETYEHTFETPGEYQYYCIPHEAAGMVGTVVVTE